LSRPSFSSPVKEDVDARHKAGHDGSELSMKIPSPPLLLITDRKQAARSLDEILAAAFAAGCRWASLREKDLPVDGQVALARRLLPVARRHGATLTLHGDAEAAARAGADGVHLPAGSDARAARVRLGAAALIGLSIHTPAEADALDPAVLDYAVIGPAYATASKPGYGPALGVAGVAEVVRRSRVPIVAVGGIVPDVIADIVTAGAAGIAVMGSVMRAADASQEVRALIAALADESVQPRS
jgi:thiamine-phosphate pyrophosphorylase